MSNKNKSSIRIVAVTPQIEAKSGRGNRSINRTPRRSMEGRAAWSRQDIVDIVEKVGHNTYSSQGSALTSDEQSLRNKALVSFLYLSARRVSEVVGRHVTYLNPKDVSTVVVDEFKGVGLSDIRETVINEVPVLVFNTRILKKGRLKQRGLREMHADTTIDLRDSPFSDYIVAWIAHQRLAGKNVLFDIGRHRVYQILRDADPLIVGPHWFRHQRLTHLAQTLDPYALRNVAHWSNLNPAMSYVHNNPIDYLAACEAARGTN